MVTPRVARLLAWSIVGATALTWAATVLLVARSGPPTGVFEIAPVIGSWAVQLVAGLAFLVFPVTGAFIATRRPSHPIGWLFLGTGLLAVADLASVYAYHALDTNPGSLPGGAAVQAVFGDGLWLPAIAITTVFVFLVFPSGHLQTRPERVTAWAATVAAVIGGPIAGAIEPHLYSAPQVANPLPTRLPDSVSSVVDPLSLLSLTVCIVASIVLLFRRFNRSRGEERQQLKWFLFASSLVLVTMIPLNLVESPPLALSVASSIALLALPVSVAIAILRYRLLDIDVVIRKTVVYAILAGLIIVLGLGGLVLAGAAIGRPTNDEQLLIVLGALLGFAVWPLRRLATLIADKLVFGGRRTPYDVLTEFSSRVGETYASEDVLEQMAQVVGTALGADEAIVWLAVGARLRPAATWPPRADAPSSVPQDATEVRHREDILGAISVVMPANDPMSDAKRALIGVLANQAAPVLRNVQLVEELRESRRRIVTAQDERARALERNIHDSAQQQLVALSVKLRLLHDTIARDPATARRLAEGIADELREAVDDLRDLAHGIYPPLLADKGLPAALEAQARKSPLAVAVQADNVGRASQDVEAAAYFCVLEAMQNAAKYSGASSVTIQLARDDGTLSFSVDDDGAGFDTARTPPGSGLMNMRDRLEALGGSVDVRSRPGAGTRVSGRIPMYERTIA